MKGRGGGGGGEEGGGGVGDVWSMFKVDHQPQLWN